MRRRVTNTMMTKNILPILGIAVAGLCGGGVLEPVTLTATPLANDPYDYKDLVVRDVACLRAVTNRGGCVVLDFGRDAIGWLEIGGAAGPYEIVIGEIEPCSWLGRRVGCKGTHVDAIIYGLCLRIVRINGFN